MPNTKIVPVEEEPTAEAAVAETPTGTVANENENANGPTQEQPEESPGNEGVEENIQQQQQQPTTNATGDAVAPSPEKFVNNGLAKWLAAREVWCGNGADKGAIAASRKAVPIDVDGVIDVLFDPRWRGGGRIKVSLEPPRFPKNVPLPQMIDVLTDLWEAEGLDV